MCCTVAAAAAFSELWHLKLAPGILDSLSLPAGVSSHLYSYTHTQSDTWAAFISLSLYRIARIYICDSLSLYRPAYVASIVRSFFFSLILSPFRVASSSSFLLLCTRLCCFVFFEGYASFILQTTTTNLVLLFRNTLQLIRIKFARATQNHT